MGFSVRRPSTLTEDAPNAHCAERRHGPKTRT
jgi:hypothetical protein